MLPSVINSLEDAEEGDRQHYAQCTEVGSKNYLKFTLQLDGKHPVQTKNTELLAEVSKIPEMKTRLEAKAIPEGKIAADPAIVEVGEAAVSIGLKTKADVSNLKTRAETAEGKLQKEESDKLNHKTAAAAGKNADAWAEHVAAKGLKFKEVTVKDAEGKDITSISVVHKGADDKEVETPIKEYVAKNAVYVAAAATAKKKFGALPKEEGDESVENEFDEIRKEREDSQKVKTTQNASFADTFFGHGSTR